MTDRLMPYGRWCMEADAADAQHEDLVPLAELPGLASGRASLSRALELLQEAPSRPAALDEARETIRTALDQVPQTSRDQHCHEFRWRSGDTPVCSVKTCGRCAPIRAVRDRQGAR
ncbi:hypothetical protein OG897_39415 [Streptomyces sp. NBC_00237]|uniref:hypothetical protein n=1 Tax=Streptomyces sp. NBC_00237 TaxID=2975687 RepID=UPI00224D379C|nr:hypothetical protein [Streptomyces sp. NBC_00237]MCX5207459.1 hypothetical protein [Streptomyces sp. NBC_00237]